MSGQMQEHNNVGGFILEISLLCLTLIMANIDTINKILTTVSISVVIIYTTFRALNEIYKWINRNKNGNTNNN